MRFRSQASIIQHALTAIKMLDTSSLADHLTPASLAAAIVACARSWIPWTALFIYLCATTWRSYARLAHIPGPRLAAFSELWFFNVTSKGDLYLEAERMLRQHGWTPALVCQWLLRAPR